MATDRAAEAARFCEAVSMLAAKPKNLENLESYLSRHFDEWLKKFANTPEFLAAELIEFAAMEI